MSTTISIIAILIAIVAMAYVAPVKDLDFDYYGAIIGVLAFLVTLLMGYQIYTVINVKEEIKEARIVREEIDKKLEKKAEELTNGFRKELNNVAPIMLVLSRSDAKLIEKTAFMTYCTSKKGELAWDLANRTIVMLLESYAGIQDADKRGKKIADMAKNVTYDEVVEFYTDYAKTAKGKKSEVENVLLELLGNLSEGNNNDTK